MIVKGSRKRAAPGASPAPALSDSSNFVTQPSQPTADQYLRWDKGIGSTGYGDGANTFAPNVYANIANQGIAQEPSNQLTRRPMNTMIPTSSYASGGNDSWPDVVDGLAQQTSNFNWVQTTDEEKLDEEAREAMEAAKKSRKQIPPFVQKLRSFLDELRNTELIRWSQNGDSFIVLDEEEFARTLIPELFKHANYASFVRQLNMYGFHKQVGLSDNSMRASERKNKSPSEYKNPYFRRGKANWMWLIQKPKTAQSKGKGGRGKQEEGNEDDENYDAENAGISNINGEDKGTTLRTPKPPLMISQGENSLAQEELAALHQELRTIRQQHQAIAGVIQKIRLDHDQIFQQAQAFQDLHSRHENSINAILTFLATVYNRSLEGHGAANIGNMFAGSIPHDMPQQGSVVDVGELGDQTMGSNTNSKRRPVRRQPLLLQAPPSSSGGSGRVIGTPSTPQTVDTPSTQDQYSFSHDQSPALNQPVVEELPDQEYSRVQLNAQQSATNNTNSSRFHGLPERDIMSLINSANANEHNASGTSQMDFGEALSHLQNRDGKGPLSPSERNGMLQMIANGNAQGPSNGNSDNALTSPNPPTAPVPNLENWKASNDDIALLHKSMQETDSKLTNISNRLSPISPNGGIPGFNEAAGGYIAPPNDPLDFDQIFNSGDYFNDAGTENLDFGDGTAFDGNENGDFSFDDPLGTNSAKGYGTNADEEQGGRILEAVDSSEATSPANTVEDGDEVIPPPQKRQRG